MQKELDEATVNEILKQHIKEVTEGPNKEYWWKNNLSLMIHNYLDTLTDEAKKTAREKDDFRYLMTLKDRCHTIFSGYTWNNFMRVMKNSSIRKQIDEFYEKKYPEYKEQYEHNLKTKKVLFLILKNDENLETNKLYSLVYQIEGYSMPCIFAIINEDPYSSAV